MHHPGGDELEAYERLLGDAMVGDPTLFARQDAVEAAWKVVDPVLGDVTPRAPLRARNLGACRGRSTDRRHRRVAPAFGDVMKVLVVDLGGTHIKILASGQRVPRRVDSGPTLRPARFAAAVQALAAGWTYEAISIGYPGLVVHGKIAADPYNLGAGWVRFDFAKAFGCPVRLVNDAAMQALGSYEGGRLLFLGLGTGLGSAMVVDGSLQPMELAHLPYRKATFEDYVGVLGLKRLGKKKWRRHVARVVETLRAALEPEDIVLGGGNAKKLDRLPKGVRLGENTNAFIGGDAPVARRGDSGSRGCRPGDPRPLRQTKPSSLAPQSADLTRHFEVLAGFEAPHPNRRRRRGDERIADRRAIFGVI